MCIAPDNMCSLDFLHLGRQEKQAKTSPLNIGRTLSGILFSYISYNERTIQSHLRYVRKIAFCIWAAPTRCSWEESYDPDKLTYSKRKLPVSSDWAWTHSSQCPEEEVWLYGLYEWLNDPIVQNAGNPTGLSILRWEWSESSEPKNSRAIQRTSGELSWWQTCRKLIGEFISLCKCSGGS